MTEAILKSLAEIITLNSDGTPILISIHKSDGLPDIVPLWKFYDEEIIKESDVNKCIIRIRITLKRWKHLKQNFHRFIVDSGLYRENESANCFDITRWKVMEYSSKKYQIEIMIDMKRFD
ncbi:MAG: hypothetical protein ACK518_04715 [bacterium]